MNKTAQQALIAMVVALAAFFSMLQFKSSKGTETLYPASMVSTINSLQGQIDELEETNQKLINELKECQASIAALEKKAGESNVYIKELTEQLDKVRILAGLKELEGPGVRVTLDDSNMAITDAQNASAYLVHEEDLLNVINELKAAGAEAISLNGQRLVANTQIKCGGPTIIAATERFVPPFVIEAIGDPAALESILIQPGGLYDILKFWGIQIKIDKVDKLSIPGYYGPINFKYARPVQSK